jgi:hypothetical protein
MTMFANQNRVASVTALIVSGTRQTASYRQCGTQSLIRLDFYPGFHGG